MAEWEINKTLGRCFGTDEEIEFGQEYFAALVETEQGLERRDFCSGYWESEKPAVFCYWKTRRADPGEKKRLFIDDDMLIAFFDRLADETDAEKLNFRFVVTLILMRKGKLKYDSSKVEDGKEIWSMRVMGPDKRNVEVVNPYLSEDQIEELSGQLGQILQVEL